MTSTKEMSNEEKKTHLEEIKAELEENDDKVHTLTRRSADLLDEVQQLHGEIIWD